MTMTKRGLSEVVTTVLVILLVLGAIAIIWTFLRPTISRGAEGTATASECLNIQLEAVSCEPGATAGDWNVTIKRNPGSSSTPIGVKVLFYAVDGTSAAVDVPAASVPNELESKVATVTSPVAATQADVVAVVGPSAKLCNPTGQKVACA